jgi:asparagine synthase (glutamine-hydrolysing)
MPGICGVVGSDSGAESMADGLVVSGNERRVRYEGDGVSVIVAAHPVFHEEQPATTADGSLVWVHGDPYGFEGPDGYEPRADLSGSDAAYCARLYDEHGTRFVDGLNGEFCGVVLDREGQARLFTDRIGSYPLFYTRPDGDGPLLFSSRIQALGAHPAFDPSFDREYLGEFFGVQKAFGTATPLAGVRKVPPAAVLSFDPDGAKGGRRVYWRPEYRPVERSPSALARQLVDTFREVFEERLRDDLEYGVLLSGGSDSRLILGAMTDIGRVPTAFHMANWRSREARTAERVADAAGVDFRLLQRDADYHERLLDRVPGHANYVGVFDEFVASGFADELASVDVVLTGYLGDTMFGSFPFRLRKPLYPYPLRVEDPVSSVEEYVDWYLNRYAPPNRVPDFVDAPAVSAVMRRNVVRESAGIGHHGVVYPSLRELQLCEYYPLTNQFASANTDSVRTITGHWSPFFDRRLLDLHLTVPARDRIRRDPIDRALCELAPSLSRIPHGTTGVPPERSVRYGPAYFLEAAAARVRRALREERPPAPYVSHRPWMDEAELIRHTDFVRAAIDRNEDVIAALPFLDREGIERCYREHLAGENRWRDLYALVTFLETPLARRVAAERRDGPSDEERQ